MEFRDNGFSFKIKMKKGFYYNVNISVEIKLIQLQTPK